jgi:uncharacterized protein YgiM (DUF1202 family)
MPLISKALGATLGILAIAALVVATPVFAQQNPPMTGQEPPLDEQSPSGPPPNGQAPGGPPPSNQQEVGPPPNGQPPAAQLRPGSARTALVTADVNLRSGPGTNTPIVATIPGGSTVRITSCNGEWCAVSWNGRNGFAIARNLDTGGPRQARRSPVQPGYAEGPDDGYGPPVVYEGPGYYPPPAVVYGPGYYGPGYYGPGWGRRGRW